MLIESADEVETTHKFKPNKPTSNGPWYIIDQESNLAILHKSTIELLTLVQMFITPLTLVYDEFKDRMILLQLIFDCIWVVGIGLSFVTTTNKSKTLKDIAFEYFVSGLFFIDIISTVPAMVTLERNNMVSFCKFLRLIRFSAMFNPFYRIIECVFSWKSTFEIHDIFSLLVIFAAVAVIAHMSACMWIYLGHV